MPLTMRKTCKILTAFLGSFLILTAIIGYSQYLTLKKTLIAEISGKATALIGQEVEIKDIFLDSAARITLADIVIKNPEGFIQGDFLRINKIRLDMRFRELFRGRFSFRSIEVASPELSLMTAEGKLNISDKFRKFISKKGTAAYQIDDLSITDADFSFNNEPLYRVRDMNLSMNNLSSAQGTKTSLRASLAFWDSNRMTLEGWAYLKDKTPQFSISAIARDINFSLLSLLQKPKIVIPEVLSRESSSFKINDFWIPAAYAPTSGYAGMTAKTSGAILLQKPLLKEHIAKYGMDIDKSRADISFHAEGDTDHGIKIKAEAKVKSRGMSLFRKDIFRKDAMNSISLTAEAFLDMKKEALTVSKALFTAGDSSFIQAKGTIQNMFSTPLYSAEIKVNKLDLSSFNIMKDLKVNGIIMSDLIQVKGTLSSGLPEAAGTVTISNGALSMDNADIQGLNGKMTFASGKDLSFTLGASARILKAGDAIFRQPVEMKLAAEGKGTPGKIMLKSELNLSGIDLELKGKDVRAGFLKAVYDGTIQGKVVSGKVSLEAKDLSYDRYKAKNLRTDLFVDYDSKKITVKNMSVVSDIFKAAGEMITVTLPQVRGKIIMEAKNLSATYPAKKAALKGLDCMVSMPGGNSGLSGDVSFAAQQVSFQDISSGPIIGKGSIANNEFSIDIPSAKLFEGSVRIFAKGKSVNNLFPLNVFLTAENINLKLVSDTAKYFFKTPYAASGSAELLSFDGTISSSESVMGSASVRGKNISITNVENRALVKEAVVSSDIVFRGKDMDLKADFNIAGLALTLSGSADHVFEDSRVLRMSFILPEAKVSDIRTAFWEIAPDRLLYASLNGSIGMNILAAYSSGAVSADGTVLLRDIAVQGENNEYSIGPINGMVPIHFNSAGNERNVLSMPSFELADFEGHKKAYAETKQFFGNETTIGSIRYGFKLLEDISLWVEQKGSSLKINRFSAKMFGGKVNGTGYADFSDGLSYRAGLITDGVSLTQLCEEIPPIKGYISGRIDGIAAIKGSGTGLTDIIGKADFWTYSVEGERTRISKEFLEKIGGPQVRAYLGERRFSKGIMGLYIQNGFIIFRELEISNRNLLGITDLSVKVAPLNNRIAIDHLMWTITEAAQRAKKE